MEIVSISGNFTRAISDNDFFYIVGTEGLVLVEKTLEYEYAYATYSGGFTDVWTTPYTRNIYLTHSGAGIMAIEKERLEKGDISEYLHKAYISEDLVCYEMLAITGLSDDILLVGTTSGVVYIKDGDFYSSSDLKPVTSVALLEGDELYYGGSFGVAIKKGPINENWTQSDLKALLNLGSVPAVTALPVNSIDCIKENYLYNILTIATSSGISVVREGAVMRTSSVLQLFKG